MDKIGICSDHAGYELKEHVKTKLEEKRIPFEDFGCFSEERVDYPDFAHKMGHAIEEGKITRGIAICGSGNGISMVMNKYPHVRAALSWNEEIARLGRAHNDANVLSLPARFISDKESDDILEVFLTTPFDGGRHAERIEKIPIH